MIERWADAVEGAAAEPDASVADGAALDVLAGNPLLDDLNTPALVQQIHDLARDARSGDHAAKRAMRLSLQILGFDAIDRFSTKARTAVSSLDKAASARIEDAIGNRLAFIREKNWAEADRIRDELLAARHPVEGRQGPGHRRAHHDVGGEAVRAANASAERLAGQRPPLSCRTSPPQGGRLAASMPHPILRRWRLAKTRRPADLPPCGGDVRQDRGGQRRTLASEPMAKRRCRVMPHSPVNPTNRTSAKSMRRVMTEAELKLWNELRAHRLMGLGSAGSFRLRATSSTSHARTKKLVVEVDGSQHADAGKSPTADAKRTKRLGRMAGPSCASGTTTSFAISTMSASTS